MATKQRFPRVALVRQRMSLQRVPDVPAAVFSELSRPWVKERVRPGMRIAVTAGSRGIADYATVLATVARSLREAGAEPFLIPAMGSHGGATPEGQIEVLSSLGITEESTACRIISSLDVVPLGTTPEGIPVVVDRVAAEADGIVVVNRIKPHTDFSGEIESGLMKMMTIGLGKYQGAQTVHRRAMRLGLAVAVPAVARVVMSRCNILFGVAILENAYHQVARVVAVPTGEIEEQEKVLLREAKAMAPRLPFDDLDVLVVDRMGKEISGTGMDTRVIGRIRFAGEPEPEAPRITRIVLRDVTDASHGNALGVGLADYTTRRLVGKIDYQSTYINIITGMDPERGRLPVVADTDQQAVEYALRTIGAVEAAQARLLRISDTLNLREMYASEALVEELRNREDIEVAGELQPMSFDREGRLLPDEFSGTHGR